ncbi:MAG: hypothetical protein QM477_10865 [Planctomycetota bacterium]
MSRASLPASLRQILRALERRLFFVLSVYGVGRTMLNLMGLLLGLYLLDRFLDPPTMVRFILEACALGVWLWQIRKDLWQPLRRRPANRDLAAIWERKAPAFQDRLSTAVELANDPREASAEMLEQVTQEAVALCAGLEAKTVVPTGRARRSFLQGSAATAVLLIGVWGYPQEAVIFLQRALGQATAWPSDTHLVLMPAYLEGLAEPVEFDFRGHENYSLAVARGSVISLRVRAEGLVPDRLEAISNGQARPMHDLGGGNFVLRLPPLRTDQDFYFRGGDDTDGLPRLSIRAGDAPGIGDWLVQTTPPAYTQLAGEKGPFHELRLLRGSTILVQFQPDRHTSEVRYKLLDGTQGILAPDEEGYYAMELPVAGSDEVSFALTGVDGFRQERAAVLKWTATPDRRPEPRFLFPHERWLTVPGGKVPLAFVVQDDFGLGELQLLGRHEQEIALSYAPGTREVRKVLRLDAAENFSVESYEDNRYRFQLNAADQARPESHHAKSDSPWIEIVPAGVEEQRLAERIVRLRERIEGMRDRTATFAEPKVIPSSRHIRRLLKELDAGLGSAEFYLLERLYSGLDRQTSPLYPTVENQLHHGMPAPGLITEALLSAALPAPLDRSAMLLDLSRALLQARSGPGAALLAAANEDRPTQESAAELRAQLDGILEILLSWEDFNSAVNLLRSLLERQRGLYLRTQEASER